MRWMLLLIFPLLAGATNKPPKEVLALWRQLPKLAKDTPNKAYRDLHTWLPHRGLRGLYAKAQFALNLAQLEKLSGQKIFHAGPHLGGKLDLKAKGDFGHYNPAFLKWALQNGIPGQHDAKLRKELQPVYDKHLRRTARNFFRTHQMLQAMPKRAATARDGYVEKIAAEEDASDWLQEFFRPEAERMDKAGHDWYEINVSLGFWVRRELDGSAKDFQALLAALLQTHDAVWLKQQK